MMPRSPSDLTCADLSRNRRVRVCLTWLAVRTSADARTGTNGSVERLVELPPGFVDQLKAATN